MLGRGRWDVPSSHFRPRSSSRPYTDRHCLYISSSLSLKNFTSLVSSPPSCSPPRFRPLPWLLPSVMSSSPLLSPKPLERDAIIDSFESSLRRMKWAALHVASFLQISRFLGFCTLFWASVVLLGGIISSNLRGLDFVFVTSLLLIEAIRLASSSFLTKLALNRKLVFHSANPQNLKYKDEQPRMLALFAYLVQAAQTFLIIPSIVLPLLRFQSLRFQTGGFWAAENLFASLLVFYALVLTSAVVASLSVFSTSFLWTAVCPAPSLSLKCYRDAVLERALDAGVLEASKLDIFSFAFKTLGGDYVRNVQPLTIKKNYADLVSYMYAHRKGVEVVCQYLESSDTYEQQAAANMVGFWAEEKGIGTNLPLLSRLADKLGNGQTGWAAANSFGLLAKTAPESVAKVRNQQGRSLVEILVSSVDKSNPNSLVLVRSLVSLFEKPSVVNNVEEETVLDLETKLRELFYENKRHRTRAIAAYGLKLLGRFNAEDWKSVQNIEPSKDSYFWADEKEMLETLRREAGLGAYEGWNKLEIRIANA